MSIKTKLAILGGGPAGLTAAIYAARGQLNPVVIEGVPSGGQLMSTSEVENYPGFSEGVQGPVLMDEMRKQALRFGTTFISENAISVRLNERPIAIVTDEQEILCDAIIITTGAAARKIGIPAERTLMGRGVSVCATCDGFFFRGKDVAVVGGGDAAFEEAIFLTRFAKSVSLIHRRDKFRASPIMVQRAQENPKIKFVLDSVVEDILDGGTGSVTGIRVKNVKTEALTDIALTGVFVAIGHEPNTKLFADQLELTARGYIKTHETQTNIPGVFAAGDVQDERYRQAITAAGAGCMAALNAQWFLDDLEHETPASETTNLASGRLGETSITTAPDDSVSAAVVPASTADTLTSTAVVPASTADTLTSTAGVTADVTTSAADAAVLAPGENPVSVNLAATAGDTTT
jgi:thioredoxin reductase (NADPH)